MPRLAVALSLVTAICHAQEAPHLAPDTVLLVDFNGGVWADRAAVPSDLTAPDNPRVHDRQGRFGGCFACDGADDQVLVSASPALAEALAGDFTLECWARLRDLPWERQYYPCLISGRDAGGAGCWYLDVHKYGNVPRLLVWRDAEQNSYAEITAPRGGRNDLKRDVWYHLAITRVGETLSLFLDGELMGSTTVPEGVRPAIELCLGADFGGKHLSGWLDEVRVSRGAHHDAETSKAAAGERRRLLRQAGRERFEQYRLPEDPRWEQLHPRLLFGPGDLDELRRQMQSPQVRPYHDQLIATAEALTDPASPGYLDPGRNWDWGAGIPMPGEKLGEVALAYVLTGRRQFADHAVAFLLSWCDQHGYQGAAFGHEWVGAGWMVAWLGLCYDWLYGAMDGEERAAVRMTIAELCQAISEATITEDWVEKSARNWQSMAAGGLGLGALAIQGETALPEHRWVRSAERFLTYYYNYIIGRDGEPMEGIHYFYYGQYQSLVFAEALRRQGGRDLFHTTNLARVPEFVPYVTMPWGGYFQNLRFGNWGSSVFLHEPLLMRREYGGLSAWLWRKVWGGELRYPCELWGIIFLPWRGEEAEPADLLPLDRHFRDRGLVVARDNWTNDAVVATMEAGRYEMAAHDQADRGNVTLLGYRQHWLVDSGYGAPDQPEGSTSSFGHNLVVIDGKGQCFEKDNSRTDAFITHHLSTDEFCLARADLKVAYDYWYDWDYFRVAGPNPVEHATRAVIFARGPQPYLLVADRVRKDDAEHDYTLFAHTHPANAVELTDAGASFTMVPHRGSYLVHPSTGQLGPLAGPGGRAEYDIEVGQAGDFVLWGCGRAGQWVPGASDSFFVDLAGQNVSFSVGGEPWLKWNQVAFRGAIHLEPGSHTITVRTREPDAELWYLYLTARGDRPHLYDMPSGPDAVFISAARPNRITEPMTVREGEWTSGVEAACEFRVLSPEGAAVSQDVYLTSTVGLHPRVSVNWRGAEAHFLTITYPRTTTMPPLTVEPVAAQGGRAWRLVWPEGEDLILLRDGEQVAAAGVSTDAQVALVRRPNNAPASVAAIGATSLTLDGRTVVAAGERTCAAGGLGDLRLAETDPVARLEAPSGW